MNKVLDSIRENAAMKKKGNLTTVLLFLTFIAGLSLILYPYVSDYWNSMHASKTISNYANAVENMDEADFERMWQEAAAYNEALRKDKIRYEMTEKQMEEYNAVLNIGGSGVIGYIEIEAIDVSLPIYHGTSDGVLQVAIGHLEWTSLPIGGKNTHSVLSGHRGLPSAKLFTDLDDLIIGDVFVIRVLNEVLTYEVDQISIIKPDETMKLQIVPGEDLCTLMTCTPLGINTHRLLVRGHRIANAEEALSIRIPAEAVQIEPLLAASVLSVPILILLMISVFFGGSKKQPESLYV